MQLVWFGDGRFVVHVWHFTVFPWDIFRAGRKHVRLCVIEVKLVSTHMDIKAVTICSWGFRGKSGC